MPRPPDFDGLTDLKFITNYALMGCAPPFWAIVEFSKEPLEDVVMLALGIDFEDIAQGVLDPAGGRDRRPGWHGRKSGRDGGGGAKDGKTRIFFPDPNDMIAQRLRPIGNPYNALNIGPLRRAFRINDFVEGIAFRAAVLEGFTNVGFETLWGILSLDRNHCREFYRLGRVQDYYGTGGGLTLPFDPMNINKLEMNNGFFEGQFGTATNRGPFNIAVEAEIRSAAPPSSKASRTLASKRSGASCRLIETTAASSIGSGAYRTTTAPGVA